MYHNIFARWQPTEKWGLLTGFDIGSEQKEKNSKSYNQWFSPVIVARFKPNEKWAFAARGEYYRDKYGVLIYLPVPGGFSTVGYSANVDYAPLSNLLLRLEARQWHTQHHKKYPSLTLALAFSL
ncbi:MAG TPA: outer membrane beta-barrel protein [Flavihumibacter sp.]|nr:outer membrane beta-barrel protein [Flavihumibacter sp.]